MNPNNLLKFAIYSIVFLFMGTVTSCSSDDESENITPEPSNNDGSGENDQELPGNNLQVGESAYDLLSDDLFSALVLEVMYHQDHAPREASLQNTRNFLESRLNKPGGIEIKTRQIPSNGSSSYSAQEVRSIENEHRNEYNRTDTVDVSLLFLDAEYASPNVLGIAYQNT